MEKLELAAYQKLNLSFRKRMVYHMGVDCGFFIEMNYMVNAMLFCLNHRIQFQLYSDDANFGTGKGWTEYFLSFCEEVHESFHHRYNFHRLPSWYHIMKLCYRKKSLKPVAWKIKKTVLSVIGRLMAFCIYKERVFLSQDVSAKPAQKYVVPELGINHSYMDTFALMAHMVWRLQPVLLRQEQTYKERLSLPSVFAGVQVRGGDKVSETPLIDGSTLIQKLNLYKGCVFVLTDDYRQFLKAREEFPHLWFLTLCQENETGYYHRQFCQDAKNKKKAMFRLIISVDLLLSCKSFVGSITTGPSVFILKLRLHNPLVQAVDCPKEELTHALQLPIRERSIISMRYIH